MGLLDAFPRWTPKTGHPWTPQNQPPRVGVRDVDEAEGAVLPRRDGQRFGRREEASSIGAGAAGLVAAAHRERDWCPSRNGERVSARGRDRGAARGRATR